MSVLSRLAGPVGIGAIAAVAFTASASAADMQLPSNVEMTCPVKESTFKSWLKDTPGSTGSDWQAANGAVFEPASSVTFQTDNDYDTHLCDFYKWGQQMFLWLTSPDTSDGSGWVFNGPAIYNVVEETDGHLKLEQHDAGNETLDLALRDTKPEKIQDVAQAGGSGVLMSQTESLVYYGVHVNDFYAAFRTGHLDKDKGGSLYTAKKFPRTADDMKAVTAYAAQHDPEIAIDAPQALTMELKTSWVRADKVDDKSRYITVNAVIPNYVPDKDAPNRTWELSGTDTAELALVGMHVVGTLQHHPEFVWASFEHVSNAPNAPYYYSDTEGKRQAGGDPSGAGYLFKAKGEGAFETEANVECMKADDKGNVVATTQKVDGKTELVCQNGIQPSNTVRLNPWGAVAGDTAAPAIKNNTLLISNNLSVRDWLASDDVRRNYVQIGSLWTAPPKPKDVDAPIPTFSDPMKSKQRGSLQLANATMETYEQDSNCFACHAVSGSAKPEGQTFDFLSHIFSNIDGLN